MEIKIAKSAGFCFGVNRAVRLAEEAARDGRPCRTMGPLIHNSEEVERLRGLGIEQLDDISDAKPGERIIIRSHGISRDERRQLEEAGTELIDATCPDVAKIHKTVLAESEEGRTVIIIGDSAHPEVRAISGWCGESVAISSPEELSEWLKTPGNADKALSVVAQTTSKRNNFELCVKLLKKECTNLKIFDTICRATSRRQNEAALLSKECDVMVVIGGRHSANSRQLADICSLSCDKVFFVETSDEIDPSDFCPNDVVGITAGASTPAWIIKEVYDKMNDEINAVEEVKEEVVEAAPAEENTEAATAEAAEPVAETFEEMVERSIKTLYTGEKVVGTIDAITPTEVSVDLGTKQSGYIPLSELTDDPNVKASDLVKVGDEIETFVMRVNDVEGTVMLSKKRLDAVKAWDEINEAKTNKEIVEGKIVGENKGGVIAAVKGINVFIPASQTGLPKDEPMSTIVGDTVRLRITEVDQKHRRRVVGSIRAVQYEERKARAEAVWNEIEEGKEYRGVVKSLTSYGAFVDIGGIDGMVHVSELSWKRIRQPADILSIGDEIDVYVISFDREKRKISLGYKNKGENPWITFTNTYDIGSVANVKIVKLMPFGAFAEIIPGVDGLIHISQLSDHRIGKPDEVVEVGQEVDVKIIDIDNEKQKVSLSIRALLQKPRVEPQAEPDETVYDTENAPAEEPVEAPSEEPAEAPAEIPAEAPAEAPAEEPAEAPAEETAEAPAEE